MRRPTATSAGRARAGVPTWCRRPSLPLDWLRSALPDVAVTVFPGTGHFPHLARHAELARLLASIPSDGRQNHAGRGVRGQEPGPRADWGPCQ
jgi:hypothetical protein